MAPGPGARFGGGGGAVPITPRPISGRRSSTTRARPGHGRRSAISVLNKGATAEGKLAATSAYEADAYLRNADLILWRLFSTSYDLADQTDATHWCEVLRSRFPDDQRSLECELWQMTMHEAEPDIDRAWELAEAYAAMSGSQTAELDRKWAGMAVAAAIARAGMADSARAAPWPGAHTAMRTSIRRGSMLVNVEAFVRTILKDNGEALDLLTEYMAVAGRDPSEIDFWWFDGLREEPRYQMLAGSGGSVRRAWLSQSKRTRIRRGRPQEGPPSVVVPEVQLRGSGPESK